MEQRYKNTHISPEKSLKIKINVPVTLDNAVTLQFLLELLSAEAENC